MQEGEMEMEDQARVQIVTITGTSESQMDIGEKSTKSAKRSWTSIEIALTVVLLLMACAVVALVVMYTAQRDKQLSICLTSDCVASAARIIQNMDPSASPCEDFYQYACGGWLNRHIIPESRSGYSIFDILEEEMEIILKGVLEKSDDRDRDAFKKAKQLYKSCMNENSIEEMDAAPLLNLLDEIGGWPVTMSEWDVTKEPDWSLETTLTLFHTNYNQRVVFDTFVWIDIRNSSKYVIYVDETDFGMHFRDHYIRDGGEYKVRDAYLQFMVLIAEMVREDRNVTKNDTFVEEEMKKVLELEIEIFNATAPLEERRDITQLYNKMTLSQLQVKFDLNGFNWTQFLQGIMSSVNIEVYPEEEIVVFCVGYLQKLQYIFQKYSKRTFQNYLAWQLVFKHVPNLSRRFRDAQAKFQKILYDKSEEKARWRECASYTNDQMESAVGALYVRKAFSGERKRMVRDLIDKIREVFIETLDELEWMDAASKQKVREKALAIKEKIGYPDYILEDNNPKLDQEYEHLNISENKYFENVLLNLKATAQAIFGKLREKVDPDQWLVGAAAVKALYSVNKNQILFPAGILQPPFVNKQQLQALNFGGIGVVIGHEITHGFDNNGKNFDKDGTLYDGWSNFSATNFNDQSRCMVHQYGNYTWDLAGGQNVNGISTLGENIADNGGIRQAYKAYLKWVTKEGEELKLPGLDLTHKQLFFLSFGQICCAIHKPDNAFQLIQTGEHSPQTFRVIGSLQNFEAFAEAFQCKKGNTMYPGKKCRVW
ncbi:membrane metallo-endopeptidase-like 1 [Scyliorhinus canicula]|uniref:membrane metallo-endopeptidase-like 1 n=1 Tax=Scyliorhinus canicula TaxID=7830 RepID=UPI0018F2FD6E|nr:membrane metallo-endopeptidase-like 1 [Scyliorhinus canicula]